MSDVQIHPTAIVDPAAEIGSGTIVGPYSVIGPDVVLGHDPWKRYRLHPDHRAAGFLTCDALVAALAEKTPGLLLLTAAACGAKNWPP